MQYLNKKGRRMVRGRTVEKGCKGGEGEGKRRRKRRKKKIKEIHFPSPSRCTHFIDLVLLLYLAQGYVRQ